MTIAVSRSPTIRNYRSIDHAAKKIALAAVNLLLLALPVAHAHDFGLRGEQSINWHAVAIVRVVATRVDDYAEAGRVITLSGKSCLDGSGFSFDVDDRYAFDLDEPVTVDVEFYRRAKDSKVQVRYERNGEAEASVNARIPAIQGDSRIYRHAFILDRARFANRSLFNTDFSIGLDTEARRNPSLSDQEITICGVSLRRSHTTPAPGSYGHIALKVVDERGHAVPVRVGIYDSTDRLPLPSKEAIAVKRLDELMKVVDVPRGLIPWPARNPSGFYINGTYGAKVPIGRYELIVAKGPEYRIVRRYFDVKSNQTEAIKVRLIRWDNLPAKGWYSGDNHIHYIRHNQADDPNLLSFTQAEDLHVANILQMGNIAGVPWPQYDWNPVTSASNESYSFVPGQEDPRTAHVGHTISLNLREPIRGPQHYLIYHRVFEKARAQGAVTGYAHVMGPRAWGPKGLALDVPFNLVDFVEVLQVGSAGTELWFDFLNLGYKLAPSAGTDYMWDFTLPGAERSYVHVPRPFTLQKWFDGLKRGATFVTNGPMLEFTVNGEGMGSELQVKSGDGVTIEAIATINPDIDFLDSLALIEQGDIIKTVRAQKANETTLKLRYTTKARHGSWFVVRADGKRTTEASLWVEKSNTPAKKALSGAIYVNVDGQSFWKPTAVPAIVERLRQSMYQLLAPVTGYEYTQAWETREPTLRWWDSQKVLLKQRVDEVMPIYDALVAKANMATENR